MKKGFTLIELLAVIVILAIVLAIAIPTISSIIDNSKKEAFKSSLVNAARKIKYNVAEYGQTSGQLEDLDLNNKTLRGSWTYDYTSAEVTINAGAYDSKSLMGITVNTKMKEILSSANESIKKIYSDESGANNPIVISGMIPVYYDEVSNVWKVADLTKEWYDYNKRNWANVVTVTDSSRNNYLDKPNVTVNISDINSWWVWIPRYKYKIPSGTDARPIDVVFESGVETTGVSASTSSVGITKYYTHPAFRNGTAVKTTFDYDLGGWDKELAGMWVGKFETTPDTNSTCYIQDTDCNRNDLMPLIKPNLKSFRYQYQKNEFETSLKFTSDSNPYGLSKSDKASMLKNTEWGAVAYLSQSIFGKNGNTNYNGIDKEIYNNDSQEYYTGRSSGDNFISYLMSGRYSFDGRTCSTLNCSTESINSKSAGYGASTTGTIYGIYDMAGGAWENVMAMYYPEVLTNPSQISEFSEFSSNTNNDSRYDKLTINPKYYDRYRATTNIIGDATAEVYKWCGSGCDPEIISSYGPWYVRGGASDYPSFADIFTYYGYTYNYVENFLSFRVALRL